MAEAALAAPADSELKVSNAAENSLHSNEMTCRHHASIVWQSACSAILTLSARHESPAAAPTNSHSLQRGFDRLVDALDEHRRAADLEWSALVYARVFFVPTAAALQDARSNTSAAIESATDSDATVGMQAAFLSAYRRVRMQSGDLRGDEAAIAAAAPALTFVPVLAIGARLGSSALASTAAAAGASEAIETAPPCIAMHVLMLDLARIEAQSWIAGVRPCERVG